jgi:tetratricopeptide (TPR) repeat protein
MGFNINLYLPGVQLENMDILGPIDEVEYKHREAVALYNRGNASKNQGKYNEAIQSFDKALQLDPKFVDAWVTKSAILGFRGKYSECIDACNKALELDPKNIFAWCNKGEALKDNCKYEEALQALDMAIELDPNDPDAWQYRGESLKSLGRNTEAEVAFTKAKELRCIAGIADTFAKHFSHWNIILPQEDLKGRCSGHISEAGWLIQYCFGNDENGEYMDYYAAHRMTDDSHVRIYDDGKEKSLPALDSWLLTSDDPIKAKQLKDEYDRHNRKVVKMLIDKGFDRFTMNMALSAGLGEEKTE